ncbi:hypothetical protein ES5_01361 [Dietzia cinnamea P4]|nr:hypothetical protein ES5_01361 [Dietzia cinnamea P4]
MEPSSDNSFLMWYSRSRIIVSHTECSRLSS